MTSLRHADLSVYHDPDALSAVTRTLRRAGHLVVLVPTMGALHAGHRALIRAARATPGASTVVSIFLNPLQFGPQEDLDCYPRRFDADLAMCQEEGVDLVFAPSTEAMYPPGSDTTVVPGALGNELEGASRPGHFAGVLTVVAKLFGIIGPDRAFFGEKDYQQLVLIQRMVQDLRLGVQVVAVPTVRDADGLALSSRNVYLDAEARAAAVTLSAALTAGVQAAALGRDAVLAAASEVLAGQPTVALEYLALRDPQLGPAPQQGPARLLLAATVGTTRLIDNVGLHLCSRTSGVAVPDFNGRGGP
ncbi:MAG: pantoate--beta-alanine ligase [Actinomycetota bacterium]|nr:pantoate--beta-alanine ligase [Actinomycetota bacterium]